MKVIRAGWRLAVPALALLGALGASGARASASLPADSALRSYALAASTPGSPSFRHFLTPVQVRARFGVSPVALAAADRSLGVDGPSAGRRRSDGRRSAAQSAPAVCPAARRAARTVFAVPSIGRVHGTTAPALASALGFARRPDDGGRGVTVAVVTGGGDYSDRDIAFFGRCYGTHNQVTRVRVDGGYRGARTLDDTEVTMDVETVMGLAPRANLRVFEAPYFSPRFVLADLATIAQEDRAQVVTISYAACENQVAGDDPFAENLVLEVMAAQGQTVLAASGDQGSQACVNQNALAGQDEFTGAFLSQLAVGDPASQPFVTAVGGAYLPDPDHPGSAMAWNNGPFPRYAGNAATGGGVSQLWAMPTWQRGANRVVDRLPADCGLLARSMCREVPDVAGLADPRNGEMIYCTTGQCRTLEKNFPGSPPGWFLADGTSFASPQWAALVATADGGLPGRRTGLITPVLYRVAARDPRSWLAVRRGSNAYLASANAYGAPAPTCLYGAARTRGPCYRATSGYNLATGLGLPFASRLIGRLRAGR